MNWDIGKVCIFGLVVVLVAHVHLSTCTKSTNSDSLLPCSKGTGDQADQ